MRFFPIMPGPMPVDKTTWPNMLLSLIFARDNRLDVVVHDGAARNLIDVVIVSPLAGGDSFRGACARRDGHAARRAVPRAEGATTARFGVERLAIDLQQGRAHVTVHVTCDMHMHMHVCAAGDRGRTSAHTLTLTRTTLTTCSRS